MDVLLGEYLLNEYQRRQRRDHLDFFEVFEKTPFFVIVNLVHVSFLGLFALSFLLLHIAKCRAAFSFCQFRKFAPSKSNNRSAPENWGFENEMSFYGMVNFQGLCSIFRSVYSLGVGSGQQSRLLADVFKRVQILGWQQWKGDDLCNGKENPKTSLDGGFKYFLFSPLFGEDSHFDEQIFQWVGSTTNQFILRPCVLWVGEFSIHDPSCNRCIPRF